mgnify:CR=1 FL=1
MDINKKSLGWGDIFMDNMDIKNKLKGTKTERNLWEAFMGECEARVQIYQTLYL